MLVYRDYLSFKIMDSLIYLYSQNDTGYGRNTIAEVDAGYFHNLGSEPANITSAILAWQQINDTVLSNEELRQVLIDNDLITQAI